MAIKIFLLDSMEYTPFAMVDGVRILAENDIVITQNVNETDIIIARKYSLNRNQYFKLFQFKRGTSLLIWTHEPRNSFEEQPIKLLLPGIKVYFMNLYTRDVFLDNYAFTVVLDHRPKVMTSLTYHQKKKKIAGIVSWVSDSKRRYKEKNGVNIDLSHKRQELLLKGSEQGIMDVFGERWPNGLSMGDTRWEADWSGLKIKIASEYLYCIAIENTDWPYYVSEKIWHAILAGCLPIYAGSAGTIYEDFEENSFVDYNQFQSDEECLEFIKNLSEGEFLDRYNSCARSVDRIMDKVDVKSHYPACMIGSIIEKINYVLRNG